MSDHRLDAMHTEVEVIFNGGVDHVHADILHRFIDEQQAEIERLYGLRDHWTALVEEHEAEIERRLVEAAHYAEAYNREGIANNKLRAEIERLSTRNKNQCERLDQQIKHNADLLNRNAKLQAVVDAARHLLAGGDKEAVYHLEKALAALEGGDEWQD